MNERRLIYLHGFASSPSSKKARYFRDRFLSRGLHLEVPDLVEGDFQGTTLTRQLAVIERLAAGKPVSLLGSSLGGYLAALYAARHPEVERVMLMAPAFCFAQRWADRLGDRAMAGWRETGLLTVHHYGLQGAASIGYQFYQDASPYEAYPLVHQPVLIFHGEHDDVVPVALSREFTARHSQTILHEVDSGHELLDHLDFMWRHTRSFFEIK